MTQVRVYIPLTPVAVGGLAEVRTLDAPLHAHAVTLALRSAYATSDEEELEHEALLDAAAAAGALRAGLSARRIIAAADVDATAVTEVEPVTNGPLSVVHVIDPVALSRIVSFHIDEEPGGPDEDLLWYDATELDDVVALARV